MLKLLCLTKGISIAQSDLPVLATGNKCESELPVSGFEIGALKTANSRQHIGQSAVVVAELEKVPPCGRQILELTIGLPSREISLGRELQPQAGVEFRN